jgi:cytochrome c-type biogenesis protein CcmH/NrfG
VQACVDWTWTFPAVTAPAFLIAGIGAAGVAQHRLARPLPAAIPAACLALALLAFAPPWYAQRLTDEALAGRSSNPGRSLRWAHRLDPVSTAPLIARAALASSLTDELRSLRSAARLEPRVLRTQYFLGSALLNAGHKTEAHRVFEQANALDPGNAAVARALRLSR